jgi:hypothetical protein
MNKRFTIIVAMFLSASALAQPQAGTRRNAHTLLAEGFILRGIDGSLSRTSQGCFFELAADISAEKNTFKAGTKLEILPSAILESMTTDVNERPTPNYRLWGTVTKYKDRNFIFPLYFLPLQKATTLQQNKPAEKSTEDSAKKVSDSNDALGIPPEVIAKLNRDSNVRYQPQSESIKPAKLNSMLIDRTGFISELPSETHSVTKEFVIDSLGRNLSCERFKLLPCAVLERIERQQNTEPDHIRFKVAGVVTQFQGTEYLLLHRAVRAYNHGNFGK